MLRVILTWIVILNLSSAPFNNTMVVFGDEMIDVGKMEQGDTTMVELPNKDSYRVIFTLGQEREGWLGTDTTRKDTLVITDKTEIFEFEVFTD